MWTYENPVRISFGAGSLEGIGDLVHGRAYCLVTYDESMFHDIAGRIAAMLTVASGNSRYSETASSVRRATRGR